MDGLSIQTKKRVTFKVIETHGMPICREDGTLADGYLHARECKNFVYDGEDVLGRELYAKRLTMLQMRDCRLMWIDEMFSF